MTCFIRVDRIVNFSANNGVIIEDLDAAIADPARPAKALAIARDHIGDEILQHACCGGLGPLAWAGAIDFDDYLTALSAYGA
jgi:hypothetical protein